MESLVKPKISVVILAAGEGKRMQSQLPKVMHELKGKPLIEYVVSAVEAVELGKPLVVVNALSLAVQKYLGDRAEYVIQSKQLGTGHAVAVAESAAGKAETILVLNGDMPAIARVVRGPTGNLEKIVEYKDANQREGAERELNTGCFCFQAAWLWPTLKRLENKNAQGEFYLVDVVRLAIAEGARISAITVAPAEAIGVNTKEQLSFLEKPQFDDRKKEYLEFMCMMKKM